MTDERSAFGAVLRRFRTAAALSQEALAARAGLSLRGVSDLERGVRRTPHLATVGMLADALGLGPEDRQALIDAARPTVVEEGRYDASADAVALPKPLTPLIGREQELVELADQLRDAAVRLVTVTGPGGVGKTRFALAAADQVQDQFADGVFFIDLTPLRDANLVVPAIASALGVRERGGQRLIDTLSGILASKQQLLLLDNCEQILAAAPQIAALLATSSHLSVLVTSRETLRVRGERVVRLLPLPLPARDRRSPVEELAQAPAVALFVDRARENHPAFALTTENASAVAAVCRRLDGLPLAIELAAAWVKVLPPAMLLDCLEQRRPLLTGGSRDLPARQRTMHDAIAWSYDLLTGDEQCLFRRLSVFAGGWTLEAAESVANPGGDLDVLAEMASLVDKSLVRQDDQPYWEPRFTMLETIREFGLDQLQGGGEDGIVRDAHARHYLEQVEAYRYLIEGPQRPTAQTQMRLDLDNVRSAMAWVIQRQDAITAQGIAGGLGPFWMDHGFVQEGRDWIDKSLALPVADFQVVQGAQYWGGFFALWQGEFERAQTLGRDALARARSAAERGHALLLLGSVAAARDDPDQAETLVSAALDQFRRVKEPPGARAMTGVALSMLGDLARDRNDLALARSRFEDSLVFWQRLDHPWGVPTALLTLADLALMEGDADHALALYAESLVLLRAQHDAFHLVDNLRGIAEIMLIRGEAEPAARTLGAVDRLQAPMGPIVFSGERNRSEELKHRLQTVLSEERFTMAWDAGHVCEIDEVVAEALALAAGATRAAHGESKPTGIRSTSDE